jgi:hypothetical protein
VSGLTADATEGVNMSLFKTAWIGGGAALLALAAASVASAAGGTTIKAAPYVTWGTPMYGDTSKMPSDNSGNKYEWWKLRLIAGDHLTIKFEEASSAGSFYDMNVWSAGIDDFNWAQSQHDYWRPNSNGKAQVDYDISTSGDYPIAFRGDSQYSGAFDFTTTVQHKVRLTLSTARVSRHASLTVGARYPDGTAIDGGLGATLYGLWAGKWHKLGKGAVNQGSIKIAYTLPTSLHGRKLKLAVNAGGPLFKGARLTRFVIVG